MAYYEIKIHGTPHICHSFEANNHTQAATKGNKWIDENKQMDNDNRCFHRYVIRRILPVTDH